MLPGALAEALVARAPERIAAMVPANTGTEAVEGAIKLARAATGRPRILYASHAFHGLTLGSLSLNGDENFRDGFGPLLPGLRQRALRRPRRRCARELARGDVAAFIVEPVQGKGVNLPPEGYLAGAQAACREHGTLFVCDEVQTGLGRTGRFFALEHWGLDPDMICVAKALSGGFVADRRRARVGGGPRPRVRRHGARRAPRLDLRRQRLRGRRRARDAARDRARGPRRARRASSASCCSS